MPNVDNQRQVSAARYAGPAADIAPVSAGGSEQSKISPAALSTAQDGLSQMLALAMMMGDMQTNSAMTNVEAQQAQRDHMIAEAKAAEERARQAAEEGGFFDKVVGNMGVASVIGLCTFNYELVAADMAAHAARSEKNAGFDGLDALAMTQGPATFLVAEMRKSDVAPEAMRGDVGPKLCEDSDVAKYKKDTLVANLMIAGSVAAPLTGGASTAMIALALAGAAISIAGSQVAKSDVFGASSKWVGLGAEIVGSICSMGAGMGAAPTAGAVAAADAAKSAQALKAAESAKTAANAVKLGTSVLQGADQASMAFVEKDRNLAQVDVKRAQLDQAAQEMLIDAAIAGVKDARKAMDRTIELIRGAIETANQTNVAVAAGGST